MCVWWLCRISLNSPADEKALSFSAYPMRLPNSTLFLPSGQLESTPQGECSQAQVWGWTSPAFLWSGAILQEGEQIHVQFRLWLLQAQGEVFSAPRLPQPATAKFIPGWSDPFPSHISWLQCCRARAWTETGLRSLLDIMSQLEDKEN